MVENMTDTTAPTENVGRGTTFALLAIPAAIIIFAVVAGLFQLISGIAAIVIPYIAAWLYQKGAGAPLSRAGWGPFIGVSAVAIVLGTISGIVAATYSGFLGKGGLFSSAFLRTLLNQFSGNLGDNIVPLLIGLGLGAVGIASVLRGPRGRAAQVATPTATDAPAPAAAPPAVPAPPAADQPSPGVMLNGKPVDPKQ